MIRRKQEWDKVILQLDSSIPVGERSWISFWKHPGHQLTRSLLGSTAVAMLECLNFQSDGQYSVD